MTVVVFLRGANLGNRRFKPAQLVKDLKDLEITNLGAAGTFVVRKKVAERTLRARLQAEIPFEAPMVICAPQEIHAALEAGEKVDVPEGCRRFATMLEKAPGKKPKLPAQAPAGDNWGIRLAAIEGRIAIGVRRRMDEGGVYPSGFIETVVGEGLNTARDWPTMEKIGKLLDAD